MIGALVGPLTYTAFGLLAAFAAVDLAAHFSRYRHGATASAAIRWLELHVPVSRTVVASALVLLGIDLLH